MTPAQAVADLIAAALPSEDVRPGFEQDNPDRGVWVSAAGGPPHLQIAGVSESIKQPRVRIYARVGPRDHDELETLCASVEAAVNRSAPSGYAVSNPSPWLEPRKDDWGRKWATMRLELTIIE